MIVFTKSEVESMITILSKQPMLTKELIDVRKLLILRKFELEKHNA